MLSPLLDGWRNGDIFVGFDADWAVHPLALWVFEEIRLCGGECQVLLKRVRPSARFRSDNEGYGGPEVPFFPAGEGVGAMAVGMISIRF